MKYKELIEKIYSGYPRQIGMPNREDIKSFQDLQKIIKTWNKKKRIFISLYNYSFSNTKDFIIDKIWFDFDNNGYDNILLLHTWLLQKNYLHFMVFSGRGYHCYILTNKKKLKNNKIALTNVQNYIIQETKIEVDRQVIGDVARIVGLPGTFNLKRGRWVIFITEEDLQKGEEFIFQKAEKEHIGTFKLYGRNKIDLTQWDTGIPEFNMEFPIANNLDKEMDSDEFLSGMLPCIANMLLQLKDLEHSYNERYIIITQLLEDGYSEEDITAILKKYLTLNKFNHCIKKEKQVHHIVRRHLLPPRCQTLKSKGYCPYTKNKFCKYVKGE